MHKQQSQQLASNNQSSSNNLVSNNLISNKIQELINLFKINQIPTRSYREIIQQIAQSFTTLDSLTTNLQQKVDHMLKNQQSQFIQSYKQHMKKIQLQFNSIDKKIIQYQKKISYYQNEGEMSQLFIKVNKLQEQCKKLYKDLSLKQKINKDFQLTIKVQKSQIKRYQKQLKLLMRQKNQLLLKIQQIKINKINSQQLQHQSTHNIKNSKINQELKHGENTEREDLQNTLRQLHSINSTNNIIFPTQLQLISKNQKNYHDLSTQYHFGSNHSRQHLINKQSQKSLTLDYSLQKPSPTSQQTPLIAKVRQMQLKRQVQSLKKKNQLLNSFQSYVLDAKTDMQQFFIDCVNQIKQQIKIRKKINNCTFQDWKKQDKIQLLIKIISNQDILAHLYERIFKKKRLIATSNKDENKQKKSLQQIVRQKNDIQAVYPRNSTRVEAQNNGNHITSQKQKSIQFKKDQKQQKVLSLAKRRFSKHISENTLLPKIHFHLQY